MMALKRGHKVSHTISLFRATEFRSAFDVPGLSDILSGHFSVR